MPIKLPGVPSGSSLAGPMDVETAMNKEIAAAAAANKAKKITDQEFEQILRRIVGLKTTREDPEAVQMLVKEIHHGSPHVPKFSERKIKIPADNRICLIIPDGHDDSMDKDMSSDLGSWDARDGEN